ncbi:hypothetical protein DL89DRAFT_137039 [Linderina pennispora]|uniref:Uncharacterized protein n=1 Tax=Linderina pennispora TaxID=61395 RepID=A0A1Y1WAS7_9FUNG|nr:uncharacterized protein DL89DRAFT_137039 [Linderina pennispora]ORX70649.1 hypothetical protein DL89DRAFT_137039 [Linderina pennispora]
MMERRDLVQTITKREGTLRSKEREREALVEQLEKQQQLAQQAIGQQNALRDRSEAAGVISSNVKKAMDQMAQRIEEHKRHLRHTEAKLRKAELARHAAEEQLNKLSADDYPAQLRKARDELRAREERHGDDVERIKQLLSDEREAAAGYMKQLNEANVHATTLEQELLQARNSASNDSAELSKKLDISMAQHAKSRAQLSEFERRAAQRSEEASRQLKAATGVIEDLKAEVARLEREREEVQHEMKAKMRALNSEYKLAKHNFASSVKDADNERKRRLQDTQSQLELVTKEAVDLRAQLSELRSGLVKKEMAWKDERLEFENDLKAAAADFETMQERMDEKERVFQDRIKKLEDKTRKSEATWNAERNNLLGKLDAANKDGFKLREELASMRKDASKAKSTSQADVLRTTREMAQLRAGMDEREQRWEEERKQVAQEHDEIVAGMKEDYAALEQQLQDDKFTLESQLQEAQDELAQWRDST